MGEYEKSTYSREFIIGPIKYTFAQTCGFQITQDFWQCTSEPAGPGQYPFSSLLKKKNLSGVLNNGHSVLAFEFPVSCITLRRGHSTEMLRFQEKDLPPSCENSPVQPSRETKSNLQAPLAQRACAHLCGRLHKSPLFDWR